MSYIDTSKSNKAAALLKHFPKNQVFTDPAILHGLKDNTTEFASPNIQGVIYPNDPSEVEKTIEIAQNQKIPLYPISKGMNWGWVPKFPQATIA